MQKKELLAIGDSDLRELLASLGLADSMARGELLCKYCRDAVTEGSLAAIFPEGGTIKVICHKPKCLGALAADQSDSKGRELGPDT